MNATDHDALKVSDVAAQTRLELVKAAEVLFALGALLAQFLVLLGQIFKLAEETLQHSVSRCAKEGSWW